ncbi:23S rRNA (cytidine(2498)-2'-O)-methyltransferase RlmM [Pseudomarimonas arenosa]|uniref:23S rRNA (Cytidine(2498)-2'-O)-methyltransferase RlmM n=1 Tax=Pseudomarimonas arenosa TaxID=2774145 RepID=A0AAW3ZPW1_9GAMM|nr:23S rRNA (cytidine(2498)-2'-O)-methyltransferase RlmM [Pseudomarimonas arenosa]MBD8528225.1 23S rRNA (cytidine(2498)-2'-O)-methyltransferase RlmM [Pseudomarimonas arenosa]
MPASVTEQFAWFSWCRSGFEPELAAELQARCAGSGLHGYARAVRDLGFVQYIGESAAQLEQLDPRQLIFARASFLQHLHLSGLDPNDRLGPLLESLPDAFPGQRFGRLQIEHADSDSGRPLSSLARALGNALRGELRRRGWLDPSDNDRKPRLHIGLLSGNEMVVGRAQSAWGPAWPGGIPRLRSHPDAPSRSALKLEEALLVLLTDTERETWLKPGMRAADLGAAPGGWSWVLAHKHHVQVSAIDNGPLADSALATGLITHLREDGFNWHPAKPLEWMVCDMVEQPIRVADRMATWLREGWCRRSIFNLKLPMKKRWDETQRCLDLIQHQSGRSIELRARQLYHDREEITVFAG